MPDKLTTYKQAQAPLPERNRLWPLYGAGFESLGRDGRPIEVETPTFGPELSEMGGSRGAFDDVDDYHGWNASPPESRDGTEIPDRDGWQRSVAVDYVKSSDLTTPAAGDQRVKRITVTVTRDGSIVAQLVGIRTDTE